MKGFTAEELAEMAAFDAEVDAEPLTSEEIAESRARDREAVLEGMDNRQRAIAAYQKAYYEANREAIAERKKAYYAANREAIANHQKAYREANREKCRARAREAMRKLRQRRKEEAACREGLTESCGTSTGV